MKRLAVITVGRSDFGIYLPILRRLATSKKISFEIYAGGMHLSPQHGMTVRHIERTGFHVAEQVQVLTSSDSPEGIGISMGLGTMNFAQTYQRKKPDLIMLIGDRFEMFAAAAAALPFNIPLVHIHGGELTLGAIDDAIRHSITKLSHLHFVTTEQYRNRVIQLGEEPWRVRQSGAPSLDNLKTFKTIERAELGKLCGLNLATDPILVTYHPVTTAPQAAKAQIAAVLSALAKFEATPIIFTQPNADTNSHVILSEIGHFISQHNNSAVVDNLGTDGFFSMMKIAKVMVGNSSSGLLEAPSFCLPVVNIGRRQEGRVRGENVVDVIDNADDIRRGIDLACSNGFRDKIKNCVNPYLFGNAAEIIVDALEQLEINDKLMRKSFYDLPSNSRLT